MKKNLIFIIKIISIYLKRNKKLNTINNLIFNKKLNGINEDC